MEFVPSTRQYGAIGQKWKYESADYISLKSGGIKFKNLVCLPFSMTGAHKTGCFWNLGCTSSTLQQLMTFSRMTWWLYFLNKKKTILSIFGRLSSQTRRVVSWVTLIGWALNHKSWSQLNYYSYQVGLNSYEFLYGTQLTGTVDERGRESKIGTKRRCV